MTSAFFMPIFVNITKYIEGGITMLKKQKRTVHYSFKVTEEESAVIQKKMKLSDFKNLSSFIRVMVLSGYVLRLDLPELREVVRLLGFLSNNVNQIARRLHEGGSIYETEMDEIAQQQKQLQDTLDRILIRLDCLKQ